MTLRTFTITLELKVRQGLRGASVQILTAAVYLCLAGATGGAGQWNTVFL